MAALASVGRPRLGERGLSEQLAESLVGAQELSAPLELEGDDHDRVDQPLHRSAEGGGPSTAQANRQRVQENQRIVATQILSTSALPCLCCMLFAASAVLIAGLVIYVKGWSIMSTYGDKPCDQPLKWWLLVMLLLPVLMCQCHSMHDETGMKRNLQVLYLPSMLGVGVWMCCHCETCGETNPELFQFCKSYLIFWVFVWLLLLFSYFGVVALVIWAQRHGLIDHGPGPARAAKPGLINAIETVAYSADIFSPTSSGGDNSECCVCCQHFDSSKSIKKTPCGHFFHEECLGGWLGGFARTCPLCRRDLEEALDGDPASGDAAGLP